MEDQCSYVMSNALRQRFHIYTLLICEESVIYFFGSIEVGCCRIVNPTDDVQNHKPLQSNK